MFFYYLFSVVCDRFQDGCQWFDTYCNIHQMACEKEIVKVSDDWETEVPEHIQKWLKYFEWLNV